MTADGPKIERRGLLLVLSSPSGAGKTTLAHRLVEMDGNISLSVSVTTRPARPGEADGRHYRFIDRSTFTDMREKDQLLEWARVFGHLYGTPRAPIEAAIETGRDMVVDIDWQGAQQLTEKMKHEVVRVFVLPPSAAALEQRLRARAQDSEDVVRRRMAAASEELSHWPEYDYVIVNAGLDGAARDLQAILSAERLKRERLDGLSAFVREMQKAL